MVGIKRSEVIGFSQLSIDLHTEAPNSDLRHRGFLGRDSQTDFR